MHLGIVFFSSIQTREKSSFVNTNEHLVLNCAVRRWYVDKVHCVRYSYRITNLLPCQVFTIRVSCINKWQSCSTTWSPHYIEQTERENTTHLTRFWAPCPTLLHNPSRRAPSPCFIVVLCCRLAFIEPLVCFTPPKREVALRWKVTHNKI